MFALSFADSRDALTAPPSVIGEPDLWASLVHAAAQPAVIAWFIVGALAVVAAITTLKISTMRFQRANHNFPKPVVVLPETIDADSPLRSQQTPELISA